MIKKILTKVLIFILILFSKTPSFFLNLLKYFIYILLYRIINYRLDVVRVNLFSAFPDKSSFELQYIEQNFYKNLSNIIIQNIQSISFSKDELKSKIWLHHQAKLDLMNAEKLNKNIFVVTAHYGNWEYAVLLTSLETKLQTYGIYKQLNNETFDKFIKQNRGRFGLKLIDTNDIKENISSYNSNESLVTDAHFLCKIIKYNFDEIINNSYTYCAFEDCNTLISKINYNFEQALTKDQNIFHKYSNESGIYLSKNAIVKLTIEKILKEIEKVTDVNQANLLLDNITRIINITDDRPQIKPEEFNKSFQFIRFVNESSTKLLHILRKKINNLQINIYDLEFEDFIRKIRKLNNFIFEFSNVCLDNISDAKDRKYLPIYLSLQECLIKDTEVNIYNENKKIDLFIDSSYILPSKYEHLRECISNDINKFRNEEFSFFNSISSNYYKSYEKRNNEIIKDYKDESEKSITSKLKDNQVSYVQIIGLYASIITFVLGSISIIPKFEYGYTSILTFMFVFASCLCLFVFLLKTLFDSSDKDKPEISIRESFFFLLFLIVFIGSLCIININRKNDKDFKMTVTKGKTVNDSSIIDTSEITIIKSNYIPPKEKDDKSK